MQTEITPLFFRQIDLSRHRTAEITAELTAELTAERTAERTAECTVERTAELKGFFAR